MRNKIRNFIFDMGNVIIEFDVDLFLDRAGISDPEDRKILRKEVYYSELWPGMDLGLLDEPQMCEILKDRLPEHLWPKIEELVMGWCDPIIEIEGISGLIRELKDKGYGIYLLSNASRMQKEYWKNVSCCDCFDGTVVSAFEGVKKPDERIYRILLERYGLNVDECMFIDDMEDNVEAAGNMGMETFLFDSDEPGKLREYIEASVFEKEM
ncbi:MAG: HAD family phosphatase [Erysipelotrichaceae bacterium]|nr:HAD family phosphatase [Erysipelotrichaceae bacterium]